MVRGGKESQRVSAFQRRTVRDTDRILLKNPSSHRIIRDAFARRKAALVESISPTLSSKDESISIEDESTSTPTVDASDAQAEEQGVAAAVKLDDSISKPPQAEEEAERRRRFGMWCSLLNPLSLPWLIHIRIQIGGDAAYRWDQNSRDLYGSGLRLVLKLPGRQHGHRRESLSWLFPCHGARPYHTFYICIIYQCHVSRSCLGR